MHRRISLLLCSAVLLTSCLSQSPPPTVHWFLPEESTFERDALQQDSSLQPLSMTTRSHLREPMVWRLSSVEMFFDGQERWGLEPIEIVRGALEEALFDMGPFVRSPDRSAPRLAVQLRAFEGVYGKEPIAVCEVLAVHEDGKLVRQELFRSESPLESKTGGALARSLGRALHQVAVDLRAWAKTSG